MIISNKTGIYAKSVASVISLDLVKGPIHSNAVGGAITSTKKKTCCNQSNSDLFPFLECEVKSV